MARAKRNTEDLSSASEGQPLHEGRVPLFGGEPQNGDNGDGSAGAGVGTGEALGQELPKSVNFIKKDLGALRFVSLSNEGSVRIVQGLNVIELQGNYQSETVLMSRAFFSFERGNITIERMRFVLLNSNNEAVILYNLDNPKALNVNPYIQGGFFLDLKLGLFEFGSSSKFILEVETSENTDGLDLRFGFGYTQDLSVPYYNVIHHRVLELGEGKKNKTVFERREFDFVYFGGYGKMKVNGTFIPPVFFSPGSPLTLKTDFLKAGQNELEYVGSDNLRSQSDVYFVKKVYNRDTFNSQINFLRFKKSAVLDRLRNDYLNTLLGITLGEVEHYDNLGAEIEMFSKMVFNEKGKGYYDNYVLPTAGIVEGSKVSTPAGAVAGNNASTTTGVGATVVQPTAGVEHVKLDL